ncbi:NACHT, LRR and PYD domains-containing protein 9-like isoform X7 [Tachysurus vachellii]|uniref:NACHT, LRR and PYD domains-containing protein 9-like isoform X7 n=1 Tax=Tachysurus vachellii TaxID=175792 RepID=UPI00296AE52F|nr:NACHT, LRR and PYD domains-containing protein 9-like isoform X7 [Tachysurus vachellii]
MTSNMSVSGKQDFKKDERMMKGKRSDSPEPSCVSMKSDQSMERPINFRDRDSFIVRMMKGKRSNSTEPICVSMKSDTSMEPPLNFRGRDSSTDVRMMKGKRSNSTEPICVSMKSDASMILTSNMSVSGKQDLKKDERMMKGKRSDSPEPSCVSMKSDRSMERPINFRDRDSFIVRMMKGKISNSTEPICVSMKSDTSMEPPLNFRGRDSSTDVRMMKGKRSNSTEPICVSMKSDASMILTSNISVSGKQDLKKDERMMKGKRSDSPEPSCVSMKSDRSMERPINFRDRDSFIVRMMKGKRSNSTEPICVSMKSDTSMEPPLNFRGRDSSTDVRMMKGKRSNSTEPICVSMKSDASMILTSNISVSGKQDLKKDERMMKGKRSDSPEPSCVSMKSDRSMERPINFRDRDSFIVRMMKGKRSNSTEPICVSMKSDTSMEPPLNFRGRDSSTDVRMMKGKRSNSEPICVSMKSDTSMDPPLNFRDRDSSTDVRMMEGKRSDSPEPSCVSMKSDRSMDPPLFFRNSSTDVRMMEGKRSDSPEPSCVSMKSDRSMDPPLFFRNSSTDVRPQKSSISTNQLDSIFKELEHKVITLIKNELKRIRELISSDYPACTEREVEDEEDLHSAREGALKITLHVLKNMNHTDIANTLHNKLPSVYQPELKSKLRKKFKRINEGISQHGSSALLNEIYTELYITEGWSGDVNNEHEVRQIEAASRRPATQEKPIKCNEIFKDKSIRTVLTKGVAGIGKTVSVQKFILDWAEGEVNQDVTFMFPLPFRELNLMKEKNLSLMNLLHHFFPEIRKLESIDCDSYKVVLIFDGLDECRLPLNFQKNETVCGVTESASVDVLLMNLIKGNLLPSALLWITTRPGAANQIPPECVDQVTEVRGFSDPQKEEYFRKRISDQSLADKIITHLKSSRSLYIMCHIPVFCWISATVLERMLGEAEGGEIPKTLTQMFTHFLIFQIKHKDQKYHQKCDPDPQQTRESIMALGKLAFNQLEKGNLIFYEEDLRECNIDVREVSVYSGVCTQIFREEFGLHLGKVFSFVHLSVQEFLAALYVVFCFILTNTNVLVEQITGLFHFFRNPNMSDLLRSAVDKALKSKNGHLDLFLRFLLGLSLETNQTLLRDLMPQTGSRSHSKQETVKYIKEKIRENPSPEKSINLFHCLNELNDHSLVQEVQTYLNRGGYSRLRGTRLSPAQWSALVFVLLTSEQKLDVFNLSEYDPSHECLLRLLPVVKASRKADLCRCNLTEESCRVLSSVLSSNSSSLRELDLSYNKLQDSGVKLLSDVLKNPHCTLEILSLCWCNLTEESCRVLSSVLRSNSSSLRELNLSGNKLQYSGVKLLSDALKNPHCTLEILRMQDCSITDEGCAALASALRSNSSSHLRELNLLGNNPGDSGVNLLYYLLKDPHCKLETLHINNLTRSGV